MPIIVDVINVYNSTCIYYHRYCTSTISMILYRCIIIINNNFCMHAWCVYNYTLLSTWGSMYGCIRTSNLQLFCIIRNSTNEYLNISIII